MKLLLISLLFSLSACATKPANGFPIANFNLVDPGIYRGAQPTQAGINYLKAIGVKTVIDINNSNVDAERAMVAAAGLQFVSIPLSEFTPPDSNDLAKIYANITDSQDQPVFVHCKYGEDRTGMAIAFYRIHKDGWTRAQAITEMHKLGMHPWLYWWGESL